MDSQLNSAGKLARYFIDSKITPALIILSVLVGLMTVWLAPREENPQIIVPGAQIQIVLPGASPQEVEDLVIRPLEEIVQQIDGIDHTYAAALNSVGILTVQFKVGEDKERSLVKLYDRVLGQQERFPTTARTPVIRSVDVDDVPILTLTLTSESYDDYALKRLADRLKDGLKSLPQVSAISLKGGRDRQLRIELEPEKLQAYGTTLDQVKALILAQNIAAPLGTVVADNRQANVFLDGFLVTANDLEQLIVGSHDNRPIYLGDIGTVIDAPDDEHSQFSRFAYGPAAASFNKTLEPENPAVTLAVAKKPGTNVVTVADEIIKRIELMKDQFIPSGVDLVITRNDGEKADAAVNLLIEHLLIAITVVFLITVAFLGIKEALIVGFSVPLILALTLTANFICGLTINRISLYALIIALGMLVDAAIVVIENIHRSYSHNHGGTAQPQLTVAATNEIGTPTNLATLAVIMMFLAMLTLTGMPKQYFFPLIFNVPVSMAISLLVAYILVPWASNRWIRPNNLHTEQPKKNRFSIQTLFKRTLSAILERPRSYKWVFISVALAIALSLLQPVWQFIRPSGVGGAQSFFGVAMGMLPKDDKNTFNITIDMTEGTALEVTDQLCREIGRILRNNAEVSNYQSWVGTSGIVDFNGLLRGSSGKTGSHFAEIRVNLRDKHERHISSIELVRQLRPEIFKLAESYPGATVQLVEDPPGPPVQATVRAEIFGPDSDQLRDLSALVKNEFRHSYDMVEVTDSEAADVIEYRLIPDKEKAMLSGLTTAEIALAVKRMFDGEVLGMAHMPDEKNEVPILIRIPRRYQIEPTILSRVLVTNKAGQQIPLSELVRVETRFAERPIYHKDNEKVTFVGGELGSSAPIYAVLALNEQLRNRPLENGQQLRTGNLGLVEQPPTSLNGYLLQWTGELRMTINIYRELISSLAVAVVLIYFILVAYYKSFSLPAIALVAIPLGLAGVFPGHWLLHQQFTATSMIGVLGLASVVIRNSLLIIDFTLQHISAGKSIRDAVVTAVEMRTRPITLTALAVIFGIAIMLVDPVFSGLAVSMIFGTIVSTVMTLIVIPLMLFMLLEHKRKKSPHE